MNRAEQSLPEFNEDQDEDKIYLAGEDLYIVKEAEQVRKDKIQRFFILFCDPCDYSAHIYSVC